MIDNLTLELFNQNPVLTNNYCKTDNDVCRSRMDTYEIFNCIRCNMPLDNDINQNVNRVDDIRDVTLVCQLPPCKHVMHTSCVIDSRHQCICGQNFGNNIPAFVYNFRLNAQIVNERFANLCFDQPEKGISIY